MPFFHHDEIDFNYEYRGTGPTLVFTHGLSGDLNDTRDLLSPPNGYSLLLWDVRGHGLTEPLGPAESLSFAQFARDLQALIASLGIRHAVIGGVSMGAGVSARLALNAPHLIRGLILVRPAWLDKRSPEPLNPVQRIAQLLGEDGPIEGRKRFEQTAEYERVFKIDPLTAKQLCEQFSKPKALERHIRLQRIPADCPIQSWNEVSEIKVPTLVIGSNEDFVHPYSYAAEWANCIPQATLAEVPSKLTNMSVHQAEVRALIGSFMIKLREEENLD